MWKYRAIVTGLLMGLAASIAVNLYYERLGAAMLADFIATRKIDESRLNEYGYTGLISRFYGVNDGLVDLEDGQLEHPTPITFSESYWNRLLCRWNYQTVVTLATLVAVSIVMLVINLKMPNGKYVALAAAWIEVVFGAAIFTGGFVFKEHLGLDGADVEAVSKGMTFVLVAGNGLQVSNIVVGILMGILALTTTASSVKRTPVPEQTAS
jgi:hypothetical protein